MDETLIPVTIKESEWYRGQGGDGSRLSNSNGKCCLGFAALAIGYTEENIAGRPYPCSLEDSLTKFPTLVEEAPGAVFPVKNSLLCRELTQLNDNIKISDEDRKVALTKAAKEAGFDFKFVP